MTVATVTQHDDDSQLDRYGYKQQFVRSLRHFESFAVAFSFISITTGIFTTYGFALATGGPRSIWTWLIVAAGQALVALVYGALAARVPLSGYSYQWASRLANVHVGWWLGWMSFAFLSIVTVSVDYGLIQVAFQPLIGEAYTPTSAALETLVVLALQAALIIASTRMTTRVNNTAVATEVVGILGLTVLLAVEGALVEPRLDRGGAARALLRLARPVHAGDTARRLHDRRVRVRQQPRGGDLRAAPDHPEGDDPRGPGVRCGGLRVPHRAHLRNQFGEGRLGERGTGGVHRPGRARRGGAEAFPDLRLRLHIRLRPGHHGHQRQADLVHGARPPASRLPAVASGAQGHRRPVLGDHPRRGHRGDYHAGAAHPHRRAGDPVHRVHHHAGPAVRGDGAALPAARAAPPGRRGPLLPGPLGDTRHRRRADLAHLRAHRPDRPRRVPRRPVLRARLARPRRALLSRPVAA